jgi:uncharacterized protein DUF3105
LPTPPRRPPSRPVTGPAARPGRARRSARQPLRQSFVQRNRTRLLAAVGALAILVIGGLAYVQATAPAYACAIEWTASPTPTPAPGATPRYGYAQDDMGRDHVATGTVVRYIYCPPASGKHYNANGVGPIQPKVYGPNDHALPEGWIHNLEHGGLVLLYKCPGDACTDAGQQALKQLYASWPASPICGLAPGLIGPVIARFDTMAYPYAALVWDQVLPLDTLDTTQVLAFFQQQAERINPEPQCQPSAAPSAEPSAAPSAAPTAAPSAAPTAAPTTGPSPLASPASS